MLGLSEPWEPKHGRIPARRWQRDLSVSHDKIGRLLEKLGDIGQARIHYAKDLEIAERLAQMDPANAVWREDVEISRRRMERLGAK